MRVGVSTLIQSPDDVEFVIECERLGVDTVWVPEVWGYDAMTPLGLLAGKTSSIRLATGIVQLGARTPAMLAMQSMSLQMMSGGRFVLGVGSSGPRIMEGWHGVPFSKPVQLTRETIDIVRMIARGDRLEYEGEFFSFPQTVLVEVSDRWLPHANQFRCTLRRSGLAILNSRVRLLMVGWATQ